MLFNLIQQVSVWFDAKQSFVMEESEAKCLTINSLYEKDRTFDLT